MKGFGYAVLLVVIVLASLCVLSAAQAVNIYSPPTSHGSIISEMGGAASDTNSEWTYAQDYLESGRDYYFRGTYYGIVQVPISSLAGMTLPANGAKLHVYMYGGDSNGIVSGMDFDGLGVVSYSSLWNGARTQIATGLNPGGHNAWVTIDVTTQVQKQINAGYGWSGFYFCAPLNNGSASFASSNYSGGAYTPYLEVAVPEPSSLLALAGGLLSLGGLIRRRK